MGFLFLFLIACLVFFFPSPFCVALFFLVTLLICSFMFYVGEHACDQCCSSWWSVFSLISRVGSPFFFLSPFSFSCLLICCQIETSTTFIDSCSVFMEYREKERSEWVQFSNVLNCQMIVLNINCCNGLQQYGVKISLITSFKDTCFIEIVPK